MSGLQRFENKLEQFVSGTFARAFRSEVQPVEVAAALQREVDNSAQILSRDRRLVPNTFTIELSAVETTYTLAPSGLTAMPRTLLRPNGSSPPTSPPEMSRMNTIMSVLVLPMPGIGPRPSPSSSEPIWPPWQM